MGDPLYDGSEHEHQVALVQWCRTKGSPYSEIVAMPNGGYRFRQTAVRLKAEGVSPGYPDLLLDYAAGGYHGLRIELKSRKGTVRPEQREWHDRLRMRGFRVEVCRGWDEAKAVLEEYVEGR